jgi:hypothetical protein
MNPHFKESLSKEMGKYRAKESRGASFNSFVFNHEQGGFTVREAEVERVG